MARTIPNTDELIKTILRRASIPTDQSTFTDEDIIEIANEEMDMNVVPVVLRVHEEYYVNYEDIALESGKRRYKIPYRAIGNKLREIHYIDQNGTAYTMARVSHEDLPDFSNSYSYSKPLSFVVENDHVRLVGDVTNNGGSLRMYYYLRPNELVDVDRVATIAAINTSTGDVTFNVMPTNFDASLCYDFIASKTPNQIIDYDVVPTAVDTVTKTITFDPATLPDTLEVGDYVAVCEETHIPQLPNELIPILAQRVAIKCLESMGDTEALMNAERQLKELENHAYTLIDSRVEGAPRKVVNRNSQLKTNSYYRNKRRNL
jgi:hypothetical protein